MVRFFGDRLLRALSGNSSVKIDEFQSQLLDLKEYLGHIQAQTAAR